MQPYIYIAAETLLGATASSQSFNGSVRKISNVDVSPGCSIRYAHFSSDGMRYHVGFLIAKRMKKELDCTSIILYVLIHLNTIVELKMLNDCDVLVNNNLKCQ